MHNSQILRELVAGFDLNLDGLNVYTEAASGHYAYGPVLAALAGAKHVTAQVRDSRFGSAQDIISRTRQLAESYGVGYLIECVERRSHQHLARADIVTNSGHVRPIDRDLIDALKPTAVIPLMWETWEFRSSDFDLNYCKERGVVVLGTNERHPPCNMLGFIGLCSLKLLFDLGFDGGKVLLMGNAPVPASPMVDYMRRIGIDVTWVSSNPDGDLGYEEIKDHFRDHGGQYDIMILAEHRLHDLILGTGGLLDFKAIKAINPAIKIGVMCGNVDVQGLSDSGLRYVPKHIAPVGFMSYQPYMLGPRPVLTLYAGGLKVGEAMARARIRGLSPRDSVVDAMAKSPAMDFEGTLSWI